MSYETVQGQPVFIHNAMRDRIREETLADKEPEFSISSMIHGTAASLEAKKLRMSYLQRVCQENPPVALRTRGFSTMFGFLVFLILLGSTISPNAIGKTPEEVFEIASPGIVVIQVMDAKGNLIGLGSGVVIDKGSIVTNWHVVKDGEKYHVKYYGKSYEAIIRYSESSLDLCELIVDKLLAKPVTLGSLEKLKVGQRVYAIGAPKGLDLTISEGLISSIRSYEKLQLIQTTAAISHGSSGGGLFDDEGRLVGITTFNVSDGQNLNFALPVDWIPELQKRSIVAAKEGKTNYLKPTDWGYKAFELELAEDWLGLLKHSKKWTKADNRNPIAWFTLGKTQIIMAERPQAIDALREAIRLKPDYAEAWCDLGLTYDMEDWLGHKPGFTEKAYKAYREAIRLKPDYSRAWFGVGGIYKRLRHYDKAELAYREIIRLLPDNSNAWYPLGEIYYLQGNRAKVIEVYQTLQQIDPSRADEFFNNFVSPK